MYNVDKEICLLNRLSPNHINLFVAYYVTAAATRVGFYRRYCANVYNVVNIESVESVRMARCKQLYQRAQ